MEESGFNGITGVPGVNETETEVETTYGAEEIHEEIDISNVAGPAVVPTVASNTPIIADISSEIYGAFIKILSFLSQGMGSQDLFFIKEGKLNTKKSVGLIYSDMSKLFQDNSIEIIDPANAVKLMSLLKGGEKVLFVKDNDQYILTTMDSNEPVRSITMPVPDIPANEIINRPDIGKEILSIEIPVDRIEDAINASKITDSNYFICTMDDDFNVLSIETQDKSYKDIFKEGQGKSYKVFELMLVSKPDTFELKVYKNGDDIWLKMISDIGLVEIEYLEKIEELSDFDAFTL
jgi:hypothetical protein